MTRATSSDREAAPRAGPPPRYKVAILNWVSAYPLITLLLWAGQPLIQRVPIFITTLVLSLFLVLLLTSVITPLMVRLFDGWLRAEHRRAPSPARRLRMPGRRARLTLAPRGDSARDVDREGAPRG